MVGQGVLRECLRSDEVESVLSIGRRASRQQHPKLGEIVHHDFADFFEIEGDLSGYDACFFCLGVSSLGMKESDYRWVTYEFALAAARTLARLNPNMTFIYVSGAGTDSTGRGSTMWNSPTWYGKWWTRIAGRSGSYEGSPVRSHRDGGARCLAGMPAQR